MKSPVCEEHGARIEIESTEGRGATFRMVLPADPAAAVDSWATSQARNQSGLGGGMCSTNAGRAESEKSGPYRDDDA